MSVNSKIEWTGTTWNPVMGCTRISPGCKNSCAERLAEPVARARSKPTESTQRSVPLPDRVNRNDPAVKAGAWSVPAIARFSTPEHDRSELPKSKKKIETIDDKRIVRKYESFCGGPMSIQYRMHQRRRLMHICVTEPTDQSELRNFSAQIAEAREHDGSFVLIIELSGLGEAADPVLSHFAPPAKCARLAVAAPEDLAYGTARQFHGLYGLSHSNFAVFRSVLEAGDWSGNRGRACSVERLGPPVR
ncbi:MAG: DUF5131 family protein [Acidobacteriota bacterium]